MKNLKQIISEIEGREVSEKLSPSEIAQQRRKMGRRMKILARKSTVKMKKKRMRVRRRDPEALDRIARRQAKMAVIKRSLGKINYKELPITKRIQIDQQIVARKKPVIDKIAKKLLRKLKAGEGERIKKAKLAQKVSKEKK